MKSPVVRVLLALVLLGLLALTGWMLLHPEKPVVPQANNPAPAAKPLPADKALAPAGMVKLQEAVTAQLAHKFEEADSLFREALAADPKLKGVAYQRAVGAFNLHHFPEARTLAAESIAKKEEVAASHVLLGTMLGLEQNHAGALQEFLLAAEASPADALPRYNASESLRHLGRPVDAIDQLRDAVQRNPGEPLYAFKLRLARIEAGQEKDLEAEIRQQLGVKPPAGDWILAAAAVSLRHGRFAEAAGLMSAARQVMQPALFFALIQDSLFAASKERPELAPFYDVKFSPAKTETPKGP